MSMPAEATSGPTADNVVLKKVASLTLNKADLETKVIKPRFVPEKLDFQLYEKFEGKIIAIVLIITCWRRGFVQNDL